MFIFLFRWKDIEDGQMLWFSQYTKNSPSHQEEKMLVYLCGDYGLSWRLLFWGRANSISGSQIKGNK
jgi:hypothetical protein